MGGQLIDNIRTIHNDVKNRKISPEEGKLKTEKALSGLKNRKVIRDYISEGMRARHFAHTIWAIGEIRDNSSQFLHAFNDFNDVFPTFEFGIKFQDRRDILWIGLYLVFAFAFTALFFVFGFFFNDFLAHDIVRSTFSFFVASFFLVGVYELCKKIVDKKITTSENKKIESFAKELDQMLVELTCIDKYIPQPGDNKLSCT